MQLGVALRNARLAALETTIGPAPLLRIYSGAPPANCDAAATGTLLLQETLPTDWLAPPSNGSLGLLGTWSGTATAGAPTDAGNFRIYDAAGSVCHLQGTVSATGGGGDMIVANVSIIAGQPVTVVAFNITDGNP